MEWARAELDGWLIQQAYEGMLRAVETKSADAELVSVQGKVAIAELAESMLTRLCRVIGGGTYARSSPFGCWAQDVRALGFLRIQHFRKPTTTMYLSKIYAGFPY